ncbi:MAG: hypothetical protein A2W80_12930 [Candidatus Riflebacteria bacterium GWC2_50_8]|nr:MAG: hypothetical protein A2W80_12930 [Candidatus Riflebacteria bacterium GWC2_50_8]
MTEEDEKQAQKEYDVIWQWSLKEIEKLSEKLRPASGLDTNRADYNKIRDKFFVKLRALRAKYGIPEPASEKMHVQSSSNFK